MTVQTGMLITGRNNKGSFLRKIATRLGYSYLLMKNRIPAVSKFKLQKRTYTAVLTTARLLLLVI